ncbi:hypothetical protein [Streptomyces sp. NPDC054865]
MFEVPVQKEDVDQLFGPLGVAFGALGRSPERFVGGGEPAFAAALIEGFGARHRAGLGQRHFQEVVVDDSLGSFEGVNVAVQKRFLPA